MTKEATKRFKYGFMCTTMLSGALAMAAMPANAQDDVVDDEIVVTGTRIQNPNVVAASPINTLGEAEIDLKFTPNVERIFRDLPITIPGDGQNVNNGSGGAATVDLRGLGTQRSLILIDGKRVNPQDISGVVDTNFIPLNMLERVDIVTGGASAVYGSDAMSGAINFILKKDFEGVEIDAGFSTTQEGGGRIFDVNGLFGANFSDDRGNVSVAVNYTNRESVLLAQREFGVFGVSSTTGAGLGSVPAAPSADCSGNTDLTTAHSTGVGSTTSIPGTLNLNSGNSYQFRDDMSLVLGECARFNFNPFNFYQTPQERWQATTTARYEINDFVEMYGRASFSNTLVKTQIAPSGTFGQPFTIPIMNPFFTGATRTTILNDLNTFAAANAGAIPGDANGFTIAGIIDVNNDGVFDASDAFTSTARRRTVELGPRLDDFNTTQFQFVWGIRGDVPWLLDGWNYDISWQRGQSNYLETRDGFTNLTNLQAGIDTVDANSCTSVAGIVTAAPCSPINVFGPLGSITDAQRDSGFFTAIAFDNREAVQTVIHASTNGSVEQVTSPWASTPLTMAIGFEYRKETAFSAPDECLKLTPSSCQGGAGGSRLPVNTEYRAWEGFGEAIWPVIEGRPFIENFSIEAGYRYSDFNPQGQTDTWKAGASWEIVPGFRLRYMEQQAVRVANIGELGTAITTGLSNATFDPCSVGNPATPAPGSTLFNLCTQTGVPASLVGLVPDIISGQVNIFSGTNPAALPEPETARTRTIGAVWQPSLEMLGGFTGTTLSVDYYDINIKNFIGAPSGQEALDACYVLADPTACSGVVRTLGGSITVSGTGVPAFLTNFEFFRAEGIEVGLQTGYELPENFGFLNFAFNGNYYLTNEFQTAATSAVLDCNGFYGTSCNPVPTWRHTARLGWDQGAFDASLLWRHLSGMDAQANEAAALFPAFQSVEAFDYFDFSAGFQINEHARISGLVTNLLNTDPPILGNNTGTTSFNSGNTFPSLYDTVGRTYSVRVKFDF